MRAHRRTINLPTRCRYHIADKLRAPRPIRRRNNHSLLHARVPKQRCLNLPRLNPEAANLDLLVRTPHNLQNPIAAPARQVPAAVHPAPRTTIPIRTKTLLRQPTTPKITTRQTSPRNVKLPNNPNRYRLQPTIQNVNTRVGDAAPDE